jgi:hypothetical protein
MNYTTVELELIERMPNLRPQASLAASNVWIIQWLREADPASGYREDRQTGVELHQWMEKRRPNWSHLIVCKSKAETIAAIERATFVAIKRGLKPILHIESHGDEAGIEGTDGKGGVEHLAWAELRASLARLNIATRLNLLVFMAACTGFAGISSLIEFERAPALALVGSAGKITDKQLLEGAMEFYRRFLAGDLTLHEMASEASRQAGDDMWFEPEIFTTFARDALIDAVMKRGRQGCLRQEDVDAWQAMWDRLTMTDLFPENSERFGLDVRGIVREAMCFFGPTE